MMSTTFAGRIIAEGFLYFQPRIIDPMGFRLSITDKQLVANDVLNDVSLYDTGAIFFNTQNKFLNIDEAGKLVASNLVNFAFELESRPAGNKWFYNLKYNGLSVFQLCSDDLIGFQSNCQVKRYISIRFARNWLFKPLKKLPGPSSIHDSRVVHLKKVKPVEKILPIRNSHQSAGDTAPN